MILASQENSLVYNTTLAKLSIGRIPVLPKRNDDATRTPHFQLSTDTPLANPSLSLPPCNRFQASIYLDPTTI